MERFYGYSRQSRALRTLKKRIAQSMEADILSNFSFFKPFSRPSKTEHASDLTCLEIFNALPNVWASSEEFVLFTLGHLSLQKMRKKDRGSNAKDSSRKGVSVLDIDGSSS